MKPGEVWRLGNSPENPRPAGRSSADRPLASATPLHGTQRPPAHRPHGFLEHSCLTGTCWGGGRAAGFLLPRCRLSPLLRAVLCVWFAELRIKPGRARSWGVNSLLLGFLRTLGVGAWLVTWLTLFRERGGNRASVSSACVRVMCLRRHVGKPRSNICHFI